MANKLVRDLAGSSDLKLLLSGSDSAGWSFTQVLPPKTALYAHGTVSTSGNGTMVAAAGAGTSIVVDVLTLHNQASGTAVQAKMTNGTAGSVLAHAYMPNQGDGLHASYPADVRPRTDANTPLLLNISASVPVVYTAIYHVES